MLEIRRAGEPDFWSEYRKTHASGKYDDLSDTEEGVEIRRRLRIAMLQSQYYLCAYCCKQISAENSMNEHIKPKGLSQYVNNSMDYDNLIACCKTEGKNATCSAAKRNIYDEKLFVSPLQEECSKHFRFYTNGIIEGVTKAGKYTVELLNLNAYHLQKARGAQYKAALSCHSSELVKQSFLTPDEEGKLESYADFISFFYDRGYFTVE